MLAGSKDIDTLKGKYTTIFGDGDTQASKII